MSLTLKTRIDNLKANADYKELFEKELFVNKVIELQQSLLYTDNKEKVLSQLYGLAFVKNLLDNLE